MAGIYTMRDLATNAVFQVEVPAFVLSYPYLSN